MIDFKALHNCSVDPQVLHLWAQGRYFRCGYHHYEDAGSKSEEENRKDRNVGWSFLSSMVPPVLVIGACKERPVRAGQFCLDHVMLEPNTKIALSEVKLESSPQSSAPVVHEGSRARIFEGYDVGHEDRCQRGPESGFVDQLVDSEPMLPSASVKVTEDNDDLRRSSFQSETPSPD